MSLGRRCAHDVAYSGSPARVGGCAMSDDPAVEAAPSATYHPPLVYRKDELT